MPRVSRHQSELHRAAIEEAAGRLFRERGLQTVSVADLMGAVGLTHGGFYGHFESKDALAAIACRQAFAQSAARWQERTRHKRSPRTARQAIAEAYLNADTREAPGRACPASMLAADVAREDADKPVRAAYAEGVGALVDLLAQWQDGGPDREQALVQLATLAGALLLARGTAGTPLSDEFLEAARHHVVAAPRG